MPLPVAAVTVTLTRIAGLGPFTSDARPYVRAKIEGRWFGRSRTLDVTDTELDLTRGSVAWSREIAVTGAPVAVLVEVWNDRGDLAPESLASLSLTLESPYDPGPRTLGGGPTVELTVDVREVPLGAPVGFVKRSIEGDLTRATLRAVNVVVVEITRVRGLYAPIANGAPGLARAEARDGYTSHDDLGRVYVNHDLDRKFKKDTQQVEETVKLHAARGRVPPDAEVRWSVREPDDPTDDDPFFHRQWGRYVDPKDYDKTGRHTGAAGGDNEGHAAKNPPWEPVAGYDLLRAKVDQAASAVVGDESRVVFHCPDTAGDNFILRAEVTSATAMDAFAAETGVITMWHRIDVQYLRMPGAQKLPVESVPVAYEPACVELDIAPEEPIAEELDLAPDDDTLDTVISAWVDARFTKKSEPGWFCLIAAMRPYPPPTVKVADLVVFDGEVKLHVGGVASWYYEYFDIPGEHWKIEGVRAGVDFVRFSADGRTIAFNLFRTEPAPGGKSTRCLVAGHYLQPEFTAGDGNIEHAYAVSYEYHPRARLIGAKVTKGGYGLPDTVHAEVYLPGASFTAGISPTVERKVKGKVREYFAGRTVVFTLTSSYWSEKDHKPTASAQAEMLQAINHELCHAFGMPHICGHYDTRLPRDRSCCMNYFLNWLLDARAELVVDSEDRMGERLCGRHLKEIRRTHLEENPGLDWK
jgi:hypothetical protein